MSAVLVGVLPALALWLWTTPARPKPTVWSPGRRGRSWWTGRGRGRPGGPRGRGKDEEVEVTEAMELIALALSSGAAVVPALGEVAAAIRGRRGAELSRVAAAMAWGFDDDRAWTASGEEWAPVRRALALAQRSGVPPADLLVAGAADLRRDRSAALEAAAARLGVHLVLPLGLLFLPSFLLTTVIPIVLALATGLLLSA